MSVKPDTKIYFETLRKLLTDHSDVIDFEIVKKRVSEVSGFIDIEFID